MSESFSAIGVAASPGSKVMAAEAAVEAAASSRTVVCFSSSAVMDFAWVSAEASQGVTTQAERREAASSSAARAQVFQLLFFMAHTPPGGGPSLLIGGEPPPSFYHTPYRVTIWHYAPRRYGGQKNRQEGNAHSGEASHADKKSKTREITIVYSFIGAFDFTRAIEEAHNTTQKQQKTA